MNIYEVGYIFFQLDEKNVKYRNRKVDNFFSGSYLLGALNFFLKFFYSLLFCRKSFPKVDDDYQGILVYGPSRNNRVTLLPIVEEIGRNKMALFINSRDFPLWRLYWYALPHLSDLLREIKNADDAQRRIIKCYFPRFWRMYGCEKVAGQVLERYKPRVILLANDHLEFNRCLFLEARRHNIETVYVQHAAVGTDFPPLQFSYSLLDGKDALEKYHKVGDMEGNVYLMGGVRFDRIRARTKKTEGLVVGIAINLVDDKERVQQLCLRLRDSVICGNRPKVVLRPHPQMSERAWHNWCFSNDVFFSSPVSESSFDFIQGCTFLIANQCSIHLDAAMCRVPSLLFDMSKAGPEDIYGFVKKGLVPVADSMEEVVAFAESLDRYSPDSKVIKYFDCSYGTLYEGHVAHIIAKLINAVLKEEVESFNDDQGFLAVSKESNCTIYMSQK